MAVGRVHSSASGYFPPFSQLNDTLDCNATTDYFATNVLLVGDGTYLKNHKLGDIGIISNWLDSLIRSNWTGLDGVTDYDEIYMVWYYGVWQNYTYLNDTRGDERHAYISIMNNAQEAAYNCDDKTICNKLEVRGDPDVSGIGMMIAYYILTGLTIVYFFFLILHRMKPDNEEAPFTMLRRRTAAKYLQWSIESFRQTGGRFLNGTLVFATAMLGATVARYYAFQKHQDELDADDVSFYTFLGSAFMSTFSVFPCLVLQTVADLSESRYSRLFLWCTTIGLAAAVWALSLPSMDYFLELTRAFDDYEAATSLTDLNQHDYDLLVKNDTLYRPGIYRALIWEKYCDFSGIRYRLRTLLTVGLIIQAPGFVYSLFTSLVAAAPPWRSDSFHRLRRSCGSAFNMSERLDKIVRLVIGTIYLAFALVFLASFIQYRHVVKALAPSTDADIDWSFGQILALAQWAPVGLELMSAWRKLYQEERNQKRDGQSLNTSYELVRESQSVRGAP